MGAWFTPPIDYDEMAERIGLNDEYEEYAIHDYELPFVLNEKVYTIVTVPIWFVLLGITILFLVFNVYRVLKNCNQYLEVSLDEIRT